MFDIRELNVAIELWGVAFCFLGALSTMLFSREDARYRNLMAALFVAELGAAGGDAVAGIYRGQPGNIAWLATHVGNLWTFVSNFMLTGLFTTYLCARLDEANGTTYRRWQQAVWAAVALMCLLSASGLFYYIDEQNLYHRSNLFGFTYVHVLIVGLVNTYLLLKGRKGLSLSSLANLLFYTLATIVATGAQVAIYGLNFVIISGILTSVSLFLEYQAHSARMLVERTEELSRSRVELSESRIAVMVSQIQPHFLFNTLDSIYYLCGEDPGRAQMAVDYFSTYLRANLDSLGKTSPVPVKTELAHVRTYLELEKLSMEDLLTWEIDAQAEDFLVPALSLQTLVENAVKHGISARPRGGNVHVQTREEQDVWVATIEDDGVGFDPLAIHAEGHVGLENTRLRLASMCQGTLDIDSVPGRGTTVTVSIPKAPVRLTPALTNA